MFKGNDGNLSCLVRHVRSSLSFLNKVPVSFVVSCGIFPPCLSPFFILNTNPEEKSKSPDIPTRSMCSSTQEFVSTLNDQVQAPDDPHDPPRHPEDPPRVPCTGVFLTSPTSVQKTQSLLKKKRTLYLQPKKDENL